MVAVGVGVGGCMEHGQRGSSDFVYHYHKDSCLSISRLILLDREQREGGLAGLFLCRVGSYLYMSFYFLHR